jgi:ribosomal protein S13
MTDTDRKELLLKAQHIRQEQAKIREQLQAGTLDATSVLIQRNSNSLMGRMRLGYLLMSLKGIGKFKATKLTEKWGLNLDTRLEVLTLEQVIRIAEEMNMTAVDAVKEKKDKKQEPAKPTSPLASMTVEQAIAAHAKQSQTNQSDFRVVTPHPPKNQTPNARP